MVSIRDLMRDGAKRRLSERLADAVRSGNDGAVVDMAPDLFAFHRAEALRRARVRSADAMARGLPVRRCPECGLVPAPDPALVQPGGIPSCPECGLPTSEAP